MTKHDRCPTCDRPGCDRATVPAVGGPVPACAGQAVDWRTRALAAERLLSDERDVNAATSRDLDALLTALGAQVTPGGQTEDARDARRVADGMRRARELAAAREVPADVEASISDLVEASRDLEIYAEGKVTAKRTKSAERSFGRVRAALRTAIAAEIERGLVSARARFDCARSVFFNDMLRRRNITSPCQECEGYGVLAYASSATWRRGAGGQMSTYDVCDRCWGSGDAVKHGVDLRRLGAEIERARAEGRAESSAAPAPVARPISEWHEDMVGWLLATEQNGAIIEYERDEPGKFAQIKIAPGKLWRRRAWADGKWWAWCDVSVIDADVIKRPARLVPASEADADPASRGPIGRPVCSTCNDSHAMTIGDRTVMCTRCPTPCHACRAGGNGPFCGSTPCPCKCHAKIGGGS